MCSLLEEEHKNNIASAKPHIKGGIDANERMRALQHVLRHAPAVEKEMSSSGRRARARLEQVAERCRSIDGFSHFAFSPGKTPAFMFVIRKEENTHELNIGA